MTEYAHRNTVQAFMLKTDNLPQIFKAFGDKYAAEVSWRKGDIWRISFWPNVEGPEETHALPGEYLVFTGDQVEVMPFNVFNQTYIQVDEDA